MKAARLDEMEPVSYTHLGVLLSLNRRFLLLILDAAQAN